MKHHILLATCAISALTLGATSALAAAAAANSGTTLGELVVTAERREENLQDTPVAVSAFSAQTLQSRGLKGGQDLLLQVPNVNYSRSNFGGYNFKIRGIGVDVVSFSGTAGVSFNENQLPLALNNLANTDFYDVERVEVLRGPQGTLWGRNATGGAVNVVTNQPTSTFGGYATFGYGNYNAIKASGAVNIPLGDDWALRIAGFRYFQDGFGVNTYLNQRVDGRDLGSVRATLSFKPSDRFHAWLMYEHYFEDDTRNRVGKQLCISDPGPTNVGGVPIAQPTPAVVVGGLPFATTDVFSNYASYLNQGCLPGPLNSDAAYGTVNTNGTSVVLANLIGLNDGTNLNRNTPLQDHNLHNITSVRQPLFKSVEDLAELHLEYKLTDNLTLTSMTGFNHTKGSSVEDYNRNVPTTPYTPVVNSALGPLGYLLFPGGVVHDPQVGTFNTPITFDYGTSDYNEYSEELRLASSFSGKLNFNIGAGFSETTSPDGSDNYYVFATTLTPLAEAFNAIGSPIYIEPNTSPSGVLGNSLPTGAGHNYYDARNGGGFLKTYDVSGELYYQIVPTLKLTLGARYNVDQLYNRSYPISLFTSADTGNAPIAGATFPSLIGPIPTFGFPGFPTQVCTTSPSACLFPQRVTYKEVTGRVNLDWTPTLSFTDKTLIYATYSRGYKGGGFNTPCQASFGTVGNAGSACPYPTSYAPEFINAYEIGTKNTLLGGKLTLDLTGFYYDYSNYQISTIVAKSSVNININTKIYGAEFESVFSPIQDLILNLNVGYLHTKIDNGSSFIDTMNLTQGNPNYTLLHGLDGTACLAPTPYLAALIADGAPAFTLATGGEPFGAPNTLFAGACQDAGYDVANAFFGGGFNKAYENGIPVQLGGKQMPNAPHWTISAGAQYTLRLPGEWTATPRIDWYWQDSSFARVFNAVNDFLPAYHVLNASLTLAQKPMGLEAQLWIKNLANAQPITGVYLTNDTSGLFQNTFTLDPRTYGFTLTKRW